MSDDSDRQTDSFARRSLLRLLGAGTALSVTSGVVAGQNEDATPAPPLTETPGGESAGAPPPVDPAYGYPGGPEEDVPDAFEPDATVAMRTSTQTEAVLGDFSFDPVGLHVDDGALVLFDGVSPEHTVTGYHEAQGRSQRIPEAVPPLSSPVIAEDGFWVYRFPEPGVYDLYCTTHEFYGMVMRVVVGDQAEWTVVRDEDGRPPFGSAQAVFDQPELEPEAIVDSERVARDDLDLDNGDETPEPSGDGT